MDLHCTLVRRYAIIFAKKTLLRTFCGGLKLLFFCGTTKNLLVEKISFFDKGKEICHHQQSSPTATSRCSVT
jgi:hypothetical protein